MSAQSIGLAVRKELTRQARAFRGERVCIALSGGVDSCSVLASLLEAGHKPSVISYTPSTHESTDYRYAKQTAARLSLPFYPAVVDVDPGALEGYARYLVERGHRSKLAVECLAPMLGVLRVAAGHGVLFTGDQADGYYINNNWMSRNYDRAQGIPGYQRTHVREDKTSERIDKLRSIYYEEDRSCSEALVGLGRELGLRVVVPYRSRNIYETFRGSHWSMVNTPRLKEPVWLAYEDYFDKRFAVRAVPVNLHRGDSRFADTMGRELLARFPGPWRTPFGLYSAMARGEV